MLRLQAQLEGPPPQQQMGNQANAQQQEDDDANCVDRTILRILACQVRWLVACVSCQRPNQVQMPVVRVVTEEEYRMAELALEIPTFPCSENLCCIPCDIATLCHLCTGSIACGIRPRIYDKCCPSLLPPYLMGNGHDTCFNIPTTCCEYPDQEFRRRAAVGFQNGELVPSDIVAQNRQALARLAEGVPRPPERDDVD